MRPACGAGARLSLVPKKKSWPVVHQDFNSAPAGPYLLLVRGHVASVDHPPPSFQLQPPSVNAILPPPPDLRLSFVEKKKERKISFLKDSPGQRTGEDRA